MNPRQRRAVLLLALSVAGMVAVFALVAGYVSDVKKEVDPKIEVLALTRDAPAFRSLSDDMVELVEIPKRYAPPTALRDRTQIIGLVPGSTLTKGSILQEGMLSSQPALAAGEREEAILVDANTGVNGKITSGSIVDIIASYDAEANGGSEAGGRPTSEVVVPAARIIDVGEVRFKGGGTADQTQDPEQVVPVTFALTPKEALRVSFAEANAAEVRLSLRRSGDTSPLAKGEKVYKRPQGAAQ
jgi:pilus assembly protein CpaB